MKARCCARACCPHDFARTRLRRGGAPQAPGIIASGAVVVLGAPRFNCAGRAGAVAGEKIRGFFLPAAPLRIMVLSPPRPARCCGCWRANERLWGSSIDFASILHALSCCGDLVPALLFCTRCLRFSVFGPAGGPRGSRRTTEVEEGPAAPVCLGEQGTGPDRASSLTAEREQPRKRVLTASSSLAAALSSLPEVEEDHRD